MTSDDASLTESTESSPDNPIASPEDVPVDTEPLERSQRAIDEAREASREALNEPTAADDEVDFGAFEQNADPEAEDNPTPRPN